jgi:uncharacterized protein with FMN-binding domain
MKRVALAIVSTVAALVLLLSFKTHSTSVAAPSAAASSTSSAATGSSSSRSDSSGRSSGTSRTKSSISSAAKTYTGSAVETQYGPVQVQVTIKSGTITAANAVDYPTSDPRDAQINAYAIPALNSETTAANSAQIDTISGASYTSAGYISSLQSALDKAGL